MTRLQVRDIFTAVAIGILAFLFHSSFFRAAPGLMYSDFAGFHILADYMRKGHWQAFPFGQSYGGTWITALQALWQTIWFWFQPQTPGSHLYSSQVYTYGFLPACLAIVSYFLCRAYTGFIASFLASLCVAVGFQFSTGYVYGSHFYLGALLIACILMALRAQFSHPFKEMPKGMLFFASLLTGFGLYTWRACFIYVIAFWVPWTKIKFIIQKIIIPKNHWLRIVSYVFWILFALALYLEIFERDLGTVFGKHVSLDAWPNWVGAGYCFVLLAIIYFIPRFKKEDWQRVAIVAFGVFIGFFPETLQRLISVSQSAPLKTHYFANMMAIWGHLPQAFKILMSGDPDRLSSVASTLLGIFAIGSLVYGSRRQSKFIPMVWVAILSIFEWARIKTFPDKSPIRYMTPLLPAIFLGIAVFFQTIFELRKNRWFFIPFSMILLAVHLVSQFQERTVWAQGIRDSKSIEHVWEIVDSFQKVGVQSVITGSYWEANQYTYFAQENPVFIPEVREGMEPGDAESIFLSSKKVGYLTHHVTVGSVTKTIRGRTLTFHPLTQAGDFFLYVGD